MTQERCHRCGIPVTEAQQYFVTTFNGRSHRTVQFCSETCRVDWLAVERSELLSVAEAARTLIESPPHVSHEVTVDWWSRHMGALEAALAKLGGRNGT